MKRDQKPARRHEKLILLVTALAGICAAAAASAAEPSSGRELPAGHGHKAPSVAPTPAGPLGWTAPEPPTPAELEQRRRDLRRSHLPDPPVPKPAAQAGASAAPPPPVSAPTSALSPPVEGAASVDILLAVDLHDVVESSGISSTTEPSVAVAGDRVLMTGNWFGAFSEDGGDSFSLIDPYNKPFLPPQAQRFCCDQVTIYDPGSNAFFWLQQYSSPNDKGNVQRINVDSGADGSFDCDYDFTAADFGLDADLFVDFPDMQLGATVLYATTNSYTGGDEDAGGSKFQKSVVYRIPLDQLGHCQSLDYDYFTATDFNARVAAQTGNVGYWAYHAYGDNGAQFLRVAAWPESGSVSLRDVAISLPADAHYGDYRCPGPDSTDMCAFSGSRLLGAYRRGDELGFMWNEPQGGSYPYPYVATARIRISDWSLIAQAAIWNENYAWIYPSVSTNSNGEIGGTIAFGGGTRDPSCAAWTSTGDLDASFDAVTVIDGNAGPSNDRWGDYLTSRPNPDDPTTWNGTCFALMDGQGEGASHPIFLHFARAGGGSSRGTTLTPDELTFLVNKDVGEQRWAISLNTVASGSGGAPIAVSATGNVYFPDGSDPKFVYCEPNAGSQGTVADPESIFSFTCYGADACGGSATDCATSSWSLISTAVNLPASFFLPPGGLSAVSASSGGEALRSVALRQAAAGRGRGPRLEAADETILAAGRGATLTPDQLHFLVSKDVGDQRWAISLSYVQGSDGFYLQDVTGNVYFPDGSPPQFVYCSPNPGQTGTVDDPSSVFSFSCYGADACATTALACASDGWSLISDQVNLQASFFLPPGGL